MVDMIAAKTERGEDIDMTDWHFWAEFFNAWQEGELKLLAEKDQQEEKKS